MNKIFASVALTITLIAGVLLYLYHSTSPTYTKQSTLDSKPKSETPIANEQAVTFLAAGDIMLSRNVAGTVKKSGDILLPYRKLDALLKSTDFNFANLESPFSGRDDFNPTGSLVFNAPRDMINGLVKYNFKILNFANNHSLDQNKTGLDYTQSYLSNNGITYLGTGQTLDEAWQGKVFEVNGIKIGFIGASYASVNDGGKDTNTYVARIEDVARLTASITALKAQADFAVVTMHAGTEYTRTPNQQQIDFAHAAIDAGADMVIGAHPHWIQTTEQYKNKWIFYSLGNFIFDQEWSQDTKEGLVLKIKITDSKSQEGPSLEQIELIPVVLENYCCPRLATDLEKQKILEKISITNSIIK